MLCWRRWTIPLHICEWVEGSKSFSSKDGVRLLTGQRCGGNALACRISDKPSRNSTSIGISPPRYWRALASVSDALWSNLDLQRRYID